MEWNSGPALRSVRKRDGAGQPGPKMSRTIRKGGQFSLTQAFTLANEDSPAYLPGAFELALGSLNAVPRITESFRTGAGMG